MEFTWVEHLAVHVVSVCTFKFNCNVHSVSFNTCKQDLLILKVWLLFLFQRSSVCCPKNCEKCFPLYRDCNWWNETAKDSKWYIKLMWVSNLYVYVGSYRSVIYKEIDIPYTQIWQEYLIMVLSWIRFEYLFMFITLLFILWVGPTHSLAYPIWIVTNAL